MASPSVSVTTVVLELLLAVLVTLIVGLRIVFRSSSRAGLWIDDWLAIAAYIFSMPLFIVFTATGFRGLGTPGADASFAMVVVFDVLMIYFTCIVLAKISTLWFYYRIFARSRDFTYWLYATGMLVCMWWIASVPMTIAYCIPIQTHELDPTQPPKCLPILASLVGNAVPNIFTDIIILILSLKPLWKLQMERKQKIGLIVVFVLGYLNPIVSIVRMSIITRTIPTHGKNTTDFTYITLPAIFLMSAEVAIAIISSSVPSLAHLFKQAIEAKTGTTIQQPPRPGVYQHLQPNDPTAVVDKSSGCCVKVAELNSADSIDVTHYEYYSARPKDHEKEDDMPILDNQIRVLREIDISVQEVASRESLKRQHEKRPPMPYTPWR